MGVQSRAAVWRRFVVVTILVGATAASGTAQRRSSAVPPSPDDKTIVHVLNRIGFGPSPGDVARVREVGLATYIDQQLDPSRVSDTDMESRLAEFKTLSMSTRDLARLGLLYLNDGLWAGKRIVPAAWVKESTKRWSEAWSGRGYGYMWWEFPAGRGLAAAASRRSATAARPSR